MIECHEHALRILLHKDQKSLDAPNINDLGNSILIDDTTFDKAAQSYQHAVTHYLCVKMELWIEFFMNPRHGVTGGLLTNDFFTGR